MRVQDDNGCDLDLSYQLLDVFEERGVARVIISDDGLSPRRLFSPAGSNLARLQKNDYARRESFDSLTGYVTPSVSSLNTVSPILHNRRQHSDDSTSRNDAVEYPTTNLTEDALLEMQVEQTDHSPEIPSEQPAFTTPSSPKRKRKRTNEMEVPGSPDKEFRPGKKRATGNKSTDVLGSSESQESRVPETPEKDRKRKASPKQEAERNKEFRKPRKGADAPEVTEDVVQINTQEKSQKNRPEPIVLISSTGGKKQSQPSKQLQVVKGQEKKENVPASTPQAEAEGTASKRSRTRKKETVSAAGNDSPSVQSTSPASTTTKQPIKVPTDEQVTKPETPILAKQTPSHIQNPEPKKATPVLTTKKGNATKKNREPELVSNTALSSPTSQSGSSQLLPIEEDLQTSATSQSSTSDSESEDNSESAESSAESSSDESDSEEMDVEPLTEKLESRKKSPEVSKRRSISPVKKQSAKKASSSALIISEPMDKDVSRSASPASSKSSSSSDSEPSDSNSSASDSDSASDDNSASNSESEKSDSESDSDSDESTSSKSSTSSSKSSAKSSAKSRSASPASTASNISSAKSSAKDGDSSTSSHLVATSLGGQVSSHRSRPVNSILHRTLLSQNTDRSENDVSLSQQSPLAPFGRSEKLKRWNSLSDIAKKMKVNEPKRVNSQEVNEEESEEESESGSESSDSSSDDDESEKEENGIPKAKLAGRAPVAKKKKPRGLRSMFK